jgi:hypothetical protein
MDKPEQVSPQQVSPRQRLQALLAVPERQRTDAEWDELNELEIVLAPGNREGAPMPGVRRPPPMQSGTHKPGGGRDENRQGKNFHRRPRRGGGGGGGGGKG